MRAYFSLTFGLAWPATRASYLEIVVLIYQLSPGPKNCRKPLFLMSRSLNKVAQHSLKSCLPLKQETRETFVLSYAVYFTVYHINGLSRLNH